MRIDLLKAHLEDMEARANLERVAVMDTALASAFNKAKRHVRSLTVQFGNGTYLIRVDGKSWMPNSLIHDAEPPKGLEDLADLCELALEHGLYDVEDLE